jgi:predicted site-specific integrase-resolvase
MPKLTPASKKNDAPALPRLAYTMRQTAHLLSVNYQTVYRLNKRGLLRSSTALRTKLFPVSEIERFLRDTTPHTTPFAARILPE